MGGGRGIAVDLSVNHTDARYKEINRNLRVTDAPESIIIIDVGTLYLGVYVINHHNILS